MLVNRWHRRIAIASALIIASTAITGILWAYAPHLYFKEGYLQKKSGVAQRALSGAKISVSEVLKTAAAAFKTEQGIHSVTLRPEADRLFYEVQSKTGKENRSVLIDAVNGAVESPLGEEAAIKIAAQYVVGNPPVKAAEPLSDYKHRNGKKFKTAYKISFHAPGNPEIYIDRNSGLILEDSDSSRTFHFWVMKLHQLQFFGTKKELTAVPGVALILLIITGTIIWLRRYRAAL